ncbi:putative colanic acid biosynthesis acetyltransferase [Luteolibacter sp. AS25]|uniref:putative colanic acid biosynthesis acetyltransferase n=1 Tax=Luteolibacter sp. AS25 TaxID=3135776 RepID=UPI00398B9CAF
MKMEHSDLTESLPKTTDVRHKFPIRVQITRMVWKVVWLFLFRPFSLRIFRKWRVLILRLFGADVDWTCMIHGSVQIWAPWNLTMRAFSCLGSDVDCYNQGAVFVGENATVSQKTYICASSHDYCDPSNRLILCPISIGARSWVAADSFIGPSVTIGEGAVIGARSVVTKDMPEWMVCAGHPCKPIKERVMRAAS